MFVRRWLTKTNCDMMTIKRISFPVIIALLAIALVAMALRTMPDGGPKAVSSEMDSTSVNDVADADIAEMEATQRDRLCYGDHLAAVLRRNQVAEEDIEAVLPIVNHIISLKRIPARTEVALYQDTLGLKRVDLKTPQNEDVIVLERSTPLHYFAHREVIPADTILTVYNGEINSSVWDAIHRDGGNAELAVKFYEVFQFVYYFAVETRVGDQYRLIAEEIHRDGKKVGYGRILAAQYVSSKDTLTGVWGPFGEEDGEHFNEKGMSFRRNLLRMPFPAAKITSAYGIRKHPVTGKVRMHHGIDVRAKHGTPVVAAGGGIVTRVGRNDPGYGNWVHVKHDKGFETRYGHFSRIPRGIRVGTVVKQKQVIGYVGSTGHATGPHLHYEVFRNGKRINPMKVKSAPVMQLGSDELEVFLRDWYKPLRNRLEHPGLLPGDEFFGPEPALIAGT